MLVLDSEVHIGDSLLTIADRKPTWPDTPAFTRVYVADAAATLEREHDEVQAAAVAGRRAVESFTC